jgi:transcription-repair coupling factor (superfamily II helicase)
MLEEVLDELIASEPFERLLASRERPLVARAPAGADFVVAAAARALDGPVLAIATGPHEAEALARGVEAWLGPAHVALLPAWESLPYEGISPAPEVAARRHEAARRTRHARGPFVLVAPALAAMHAADPGLGMHEPLVVDRGGTVAPDALADRLVELGYERTDVVEHRGEFAVRGGIVDVFPGSARRPLRVEFFGDDVESIREFSPATQLSTDPVARAELHPVRELLLDADVRARAERLLPRYKGRFADGLARMSEGLAFEGMESFAPLLRDQLIVPADLLPRGSWVVVVPGRRVADRAGRLLTEAEALAEASEWPGPPAIRSLAEATDGRTVLELSELSEGEDLGLSPWGTAQGNAAELAQRLVDSASNGYRVLVTAEARGSLDRIREVVGERGLRTTEGEWPAAAVPASLAGGFVLDTARLAVATEEDFFGARRHTRATPRITKRRDDALAVELVPGEFAVHQVHGVGRYTGMVRREVGGAERDYLLLEYAQNDRLYVPSDQVGIVARYMGGETPRLHRLGGTDWPKQQARVRRAVREMAGELVRLYSVRMAVPGHPFPPDTPWQRELEDAFPYEETRDQLSAIEEVKRDMELPQPMDRLICGDVGYGKTEIAIRAAFKAVMDGKQVVVLVPTTLLAEQHFVTFTERFAAFPVKVAMLSRFLSPKEQERIVEEFRAGEIDVVIGTHRLLSSDVRPKDLGLLVVDEEQRFGVVHKERLKQLRTEVDVLTMTATPIPRTLEMSLAGIRDMSVLDTPPEDRQPVLTFVGPYDASLALGAVRRELLRGGQVFWVHDRVSTIDRQGAWVAKQLPDARVVIAHGQMDEAALEKAMLRFWEGDADVLVCTTIIESGLDVPTANTLVVDRADKLGLSQMYQLRGRVGRSRERAFSYFFFPPTSSLTEEAHERLATIGRFTALGSGLKIALRDLEIRGAGNLIGAEQHGHIAAVGFETYCRLLQEAVADMKGEPIEQRPDIKIELPVRAFLPVGWVGQEALRLELYRRIATATDHEELARARAEAEDRYGQFPDEVETLFAVASLRVTAQRFGVEEITRFRDQVRLRPLEIPERLTLDLPQRVEGAAYHGTTKTLNLTMDQQLPGRELPGWVEGQLEEALEARRATA